MKTPDLVGREKELAELDGLLEESAREGFRVLALGGEPGIGKTRLLGELAKRGDEAGWLVLRGSAAEFETELPLAVVIDGLDAYLQALDPRSVNRFDEATLDDLAGIFPGLSSHRKPSSSLSVSSERFRSYHAIRKLVEDLGTRQNLLLVLDDCQWADQASLELISHLMRRPPDAPILVAAGYRSNRIHPTMEADLNAGVRRGLVRMMTVSPLGKEETKVLSEARSASESEQLFAETGGNPFYILELSKTLAGATPAPNSTVPPAVGAAISGEIATVSVPGRTFLEAAAVAGDPFDIDLAGTISGLPRAEAIDALDELNRTGITNPSEVPRQFAFRHPLIRNAVYESIPAASRLVLHENAAAALGEQGAPAIEMARHVELSARPGDTGSAELLATAAEMTLAQAPAISLAWFKAARRVAPQDQPELTIRLLGGVAAAAAACGLFDDALAALEQCVDMLAGGDPLIRLTLVAACASLEGVKGDHDKAHERLLGALDELDDPDTEAAAELMLQLANSAIFRMDTEEMDEWSAKALNVAREIGEIKLISTALATRALCTSFTGDMTEGMECRDEAAAIVADMTDADLAHNVDMINRLCASELYLERFPESIEHAERGLKVSRETGQAQSFFLLYPCIGNATNVLGELERSASLLESAVESARLARNGQGLVWALTARANTALSTGDINLAEASIKEADAVGVVMDEGLIGGWSGAVTANVLFELGRPEDALKVLLERCGGEELPLVPSSWRVRYLVLQASIFLRLGKPDDAARLIGLAESQAERFDRPLCRSFASRGRTELEIEAGRTAAAVEAANRALEEASVNPAPVDAGLCQLWLGRALAADGQKDEALNALNLAAGTFTEYSAHRYLKATEQEQRSLGQKVSRRGKSAKGETGLESLSGRELEVANLVTARHTNREIAEKLFLSPKTVETHLRNIFAKLGVKSRVETARLIEQSQTGN